MKNKTLKDKIDEFDHSKLFLLTKGFTRKVKGKHSIGEVLCMVSNQQITYKEFLLISWEKKTRSRKNEVNVVCVAFGCQLVHGHHLYHYWSIS